MCEVGVIPGGDARPARTGDGGYLAVGVADRPAGGAAWTAIRSWSWRWPSYREVGERRYLDLAAHLIGQRGRGLAGNVYPEHRGGTAVFQDDASVRARCTGTLALRSGWEYKAL